MLLPRRPNWNSSDESRNWRMNSNWFSALLVYAFSIMLPALQCFELCPVSSQFNTLMDGRYRYPLDYFKSDTTGTWLNCSNIGDGDFGREQYTNIDTYLRCTTNPSACPFDENNIQDAIIFPSFDSPGLCNLLVYNRSAVKERVFVFMLGGSMTSGADTSDDCQCRKFEPRCADAHLHPLITCGW